MRNLKTIYDAIQKPYQVDHKELPNWLSDLVPQYLDDVTAFSTCPVCNRTGQGGNVRPGKPQNFHVV